jgi:hypothetical protein
LNTDPDRPAAEVQTFFNMYKYTKGWWNDFGYGSAYFTELDFLELMLSYEWSTLPTPSEFEKKYPGMLEELGHATSHSFNGLCEVLSVGGGVCSGMSPNAIFNYLAASESTVRRMNAVFERRKSIGDVTKSNAARISVSHAVIVNMLNPPDPEWRRGGGSFQTIIDKTHAYGWGNLSMLPGVPKNPIWSFGRPWEDIFYILPVDVEY